MPSRSVAVLAMLLVPSIARAENRPSPPPPTPPTPPVTVGGYVEAFYQLHFQNPDNRLTNLRGFDNRSRTFTLSNVVLDVKGETGPLAARVVLQVGHTPSTYYLAEPASQGTASINASSGDLWKHVQAATLTARTAHDIVVEAGLFPSPIGIEVIAIKDNWNWSRSNLMFGLPFYHTGATVSRPLGAGWIGKLHLYNGWNSVVDNNGYPSVAISAGYARARTVGQLLYFGGIERSDGVAEGKPWRHLVDAYVQHAIDDAFSVAVHVDGGLESNQIGTSAWLAVAAYGKLALGDELYVAARGDYFRETVAEDGSTTASPIVWPVEWLASGTATLAYQPVDGVSLRLEYRHDHASDDAFFGGGVATDPATQRYVPDREMQDTVTAGVTAWF